ncbi:hypothetical protein Celaphus_00018860, partial [Cervus elaphus hippelaphus]
TKRQNSGALFVPGSLSHVNGTRVLIAEEFNVSLDHVFLRFDHSGARSTQELDHSGAGKMTVALIGIALGISGMETQFIELLV